MCTLSADIIRNIIVASKRNCPDISLCIALQAYAGLRSAELCELRNEHHPDGGSIKLGAGEIYISHGLRITRIPNGYVEIVKGLCDAHTIYIHTKCIDTRHPLFINKNGTALSVDGYIRRVKALGDYIAHSDDAVLSEAKNYILYARGNLTSDMFRLWYEINIAHCAIRVGGAEMR